MKLNLFIAFNFHVIWVYCLLIYDFLLFFSWALQFYCWLKWIWLIFGSNTANVRSISLKLIASVVKIFEIFLLRSVEWKSRRRQLVIDKNRNVRQLDKRCERARKKFMISNCYQWVVSFSLYPFWISIQRKNPFDNKTIDAPFM